jgi:thiol-disulfide isomerase/thioredoxin
MLYDRCIVKRNGQRIVKKQHMKHLANNSSLGTVYVTLFLIAAGILWTRGQTNSAAGWGDGFVKTNGEWVTIGRIMVKTNSSALTEEFIRFKWRSDGLWDILNSKATNRLELFVDGARGLIRDYPKRPNGYTDLMAAMDDYQTLGEMEKARALAGELAGSSAPDNLKLWAKGFLNRLDSRNKPVSLQFTAVDGKPVDLAAMKGKVVLVDFWATTCGPCVKELPRVKELYDRYHGQGFEIIGISCDTDKDSLNRFLKEKGLAWPQYFDSKQQTDNKFALAFGVDGIPHMFLVDKKGVLRFDNLRADDKIHINGDRITLEEKITKLLAEPGKSD